jgi:hypothetical protein
VISVQMASPINVPLAELFEYFNSGWHTYFEALIGHYRVGLPSAFRATPRIAFETANAKPEVGGPISTSAAGATAQVMFTLPHAPMRFAVASGSERRASRKGARAEYRGSIRSSFQDHCLTYKN